MSSTGPGAVSAAARQELVVARLRPHARRLVAPALLLVVVAGGTAFFAGSLAEDWENALLVAGGIAVIGLGALLPFMVWLGRRTIITTRRLVVRHGLLTRVHQELLHSRGYDLTVRQSALQRVFGSGDIRINAGLEAPVVLRDLPRALLVAEALQDLMEGNANPIAARRQSEESRRTLPTTAFGR